MINLIKAELKKIFHKKSFWVVTFIFILYSLLVNGIYKSMNEEFISNDTYSEMDIDIEYINERLGVLDSNNKDEEFVDIMTDKELYELKQKYNTETEHYLIDTFVYELIYDYYNVKYIIQDDVQEKKIKSEIDELLNGLESKDHKVFIEYERENINNKLKNTMDPISKKVLEATLSLNQFRMDNNISYDWNNFRNRAIRNISNNLYEYFNLKDRDNLSDTDKETLKYLKSEILQNKYALENNQDINNESTLRGVLMNFTSEFGLFILIFVILISGSIVSEEFNKGTIKSLLTKPFKRSTILTSKYLVIIMLLPLIILGMFIINLMIGGLFFGFSSLDIPVVIYDSVKEILITENIFLYNLKLILSILPMYLVLETLCFGISTVMASTSSAVTLTFLFYLVGNIVPNLYKVYKIKALKAFVSLHWDFSYLVNLESNPYGIQTLMSLGIVLIYLVVILCITYAYFIKKDVKNI